MRPFLTLILVLAGNFCDAQEIIKGDTAYLTLESAIVDSGKNEFKLQAKAGIPDFSNAYRILKNQVKLNPNDPELRYFLGYTIDRLNADDGKGISLLSKEMTIESSEQFEEVNRLAPIYKGEEIVLDPYSKITSIWGSLAMSYLNRNLEDSAIWALMQGKARGGFTEPTLSYNRQLLNSCSQNSILISYGDIITIPLWYLQAIEKRRTDITVVDANLLNTTWYPLYLKNEKKVKFSYDNKEIEAIEYLKWKPRRMVINNPKNKTETLTWTLYPSYVDNYILKGDRLLLDIFRQNYFRVDIYFTSNSNSSYNLSLGKYFTDEGLVDKVSLKQSDKKLTNLKAYNIENLETRDILKSSITTKLLAGYRWAYISAIADFIKKKKYEEAKGLLMEMKQKFNIEKLPFASEREEEIITELREEIDKNIR